MLLFDFRCKSITLRKNHVKQMILAACNTSNVTDYISLNYMPYDLLLIWVVHALKVTGLKYKYSALVTKLKKV